MKKLLILFILISAVFSGCDEVFSPKADFKDTYSVNCILRADTNFQVVTVYKSYDVDGFDPLTNNVDPFVDNCFVRVWKNNGDDVFVFRDSSVTRSDSSRYTGPFKFYYNDSLSISPSDSMELEVVLPDGNRLRAFTGTPKEPEYDFAGSDRFVPPEDGAKDRFVVNWTDPENDLVYAPRLYIVYFKIENGSRVRKEIDLPIDYVTADGLEQPVYPMPGSDSYVVVKMHALDKILADISEGDPNKQNYIIQAGICEVLVYDRYLSGYYSSTNKIVDQFSVKIDELDFTNIKGGKGIFGSFIKETYAFILDPDYIHSFGYQAGL